jgi:hypothetical protein
MTARLSDRGLPLHAAPRQLPARVRADAIVLQTVADAQSILMAAADEAEAAEIREHAAMRRDQAANERDQTAAGRDLADARSDEADPPARAGVVRERDAQRRAENAMLRDLAAIDRADAAADRECARLDRLRAAADRETLACRLELLGATAREEIDGVHAGRVDRGCS